MKRVILQRKLPFKGSDRRWLPKRLRAEIMLRQYGRCFDCGTRLVLGKIVFDHRPPLAIRAQGDDANDPDRLVAICKTCDQRKTPRDLKEIARTKRLAHNHQDFADRLRDKVPGRRAPSKSQWKKMECYVGTPITAPPLKVAAPGGTEPASPESRE